MNGYGTTVFFVELQLNNDEKTASFLLPFWCHVSMLWAFLKFGSKDGRFLSMQIVSQLFLFSHSAFQSWRHKPRGLKDSSQNGCQRCESDKDLIVGMREYYSMHISQFYWRLCFYPDKFCGTKFCILSLCLQNLPFHGTQRSFNWDLTILGLNSYKGFSLYPNLGTESNSFSMRWGSFSLIFAERPSHQHNVLATLGDEADRFGDLALV